MFAFRRQGPSVLSEVPAPTGSVIDDYLAVRQQIEATMPPLRLTDDGPAIVAREANLSAAVQVARRRPVQGEIFTPKVAADVRAILAADLTRRPASARAGLMSDVWTTPPRVNDAYPIDAALATFPALLIQSLPRLPEDLEYRFMGGDLIVRDSRTNLIVDYLPDVAVAGKATP